MIYFGKEGILEIDEHESNFQAGRVPQSKCSTRGVLRSSPGRGEPSSYTLLVRGKPESTSHILRGLLL